MSLPKIPQRHSIDKLTTCSNTTDLSMRESSISGRKPSEKKTFPGLLFTKSETPGMTVLVSWGKIYESRRQHHTFVGIWYPFTYPYRHKVMLKVILMNLPLKYIKIVQCFIMRRKLKKVDKFLYFLERIEYLMFAPPDLNRTSDINRSWTISRKTEGVEITNLLRSNIIDFR